MLRHLPFLILVILSGITHAQTTSGRTDAFYDTGRNVVVATASSTPDYSTQYYYRMRIRTALTKNDWVQATDAWGFSEWEIGSGSTYAETSAEPGVEYSAVSYHDGVMEYQTYEVVYGCYTCYD